MDESSPEVVVDVQVIDNVATIHLNRPGRLNAIDLALAEQLLQQIRAVAADDDAHAVVITGRGRAFCAGGDIVAIADLVNGDAWDRVRSVLEAGRDVAAALRNMLKPVVAAVNGPAMGAG